MEILFLISSQFDEGQVEVYKQQVLWPQNICIFFIEPGALAGILLLAEDYGVVVHSMHFASSPYLAQNQKMFIRRETAHFYFSTRSFSSRTELYNPHLYLIFRIAAVIIFLRRHIIFVTQLISVLQLIKHFTLLHLSRNVSPVSADLRAAQCRGSIIMHLVLTAFLQYWHLQGEKEKWKGVKKQFIFLMFSVYM